MSTKKKPVSRAKNSVQTEGPDLSVLNAALTAFEQGDRTLLLQLWRRHRDKPLSPHLHHFMLQLIERVPIKIKKKVGRPALTSRMHNPAERASLAQTVAWLLKIKPLLKNPSRMTVAHAQHLVAGRTHLEVTHSAGVGDSSIKRYYLDYIRSTRKPQTSTPSSRRG